MNMEALFKLTYGVYFLSARDGEKDNACIINTAVQVANSPTRISIAAIKGNLTHDMILKTGLNVSSIIYNINEKDTNVILGDKTEVIYGKPYIEDTMLQNRFCISAPAFLGSDTAWCAYYEAGQRS